MKIPAVDNTLAKAALVQPGMKHWMHKHLHDGAWTTSKMVLVTIFRAGLSQL
eukprot:SAG31_NODE_174_length_21353_cov_23.387974_7_plen_52_part_00